MTLFANVQMRAMMDAEASASTLVLAKGEPLFISDANAIVIGDGTTQVQSLTPVASGGVGSPGPTGPQGPAGPSGDGTLPLSSRAAGYEDSDITLANTDIGTMLVMVPTVARTILYPTGVNTDSSIGALIGVVNLGTANILFPGAAPELIELGTWQTFKRSYQAEGSTTVTSATHSVDSTFVDADTPGLMVFVFSAHEVTTSPRTITATYNGVPMTQILAPTTSNEQSRPCITVFHLLAPASGANDVVVTFGDACRSYVIEAVPTNGFGSFEGAGSSDSGPNGGSITQNVTATGNNRFAFACLAVQGYDTLPHASDTGVSLRTGESGTSNTASDLAYSIFGVADLDTTTAAFGLTYGDDGFSVAGFALAPSSGGGAGVTFFPNSTPTQLQPGQAYMLLAIGDTNKVVVAGDSAQ